jgi:hypothetical protein
LSHLGCEEKFVDLVFKKDSVSFSLVVPTSTY